MKIAIIGAGPAGLVAAKEAVDAGMIPTVFEKKNSIGGLWSREDGHVWNEMRTNLSKWTCSFSDFPWPIGAELFPKSGDVQEYLKSYCQKFNLKPHLRFGQEVCSIEKCSDGFQVQLSNKHMEAFDKVVVASGVFSRPWTPTLKRENETNVVHVHSSNIDRIDEVRGKTVCVIGGSFSGIEISQLLVERGALKVYFISTSSTWVIPRRVIDECTGHEIPIDFLFYKRQEKSEDETCETEINNQTFDFFEKKFGNPGMANQKLYLKRNGAPNYVAISDKFLEYVKSGSIVPIRSRFHEFSSNGVVVENGITILSQIVVFCTGYECNLDYLSAQIRDSVDYDPNDKFMPFIANRATHNPKVSGLYFVGMYRGPYFGVMELQARWIMSHIGNPEKNFQLAEANRLEFENVRRNKFPQPQFPYGDYIDFCDVLAQDIDIFPEKCSNDNVANLIRTGPVVPAHYRIGNVVDEEDEFVKIIKGINHITE